MKFGPFSFRSSSFQPVHANRMPRTSKSDFRDAIESFKSLIKIFEQDPSVETFEALKYFDAFLGAQFHNDFNSSILCLTKDEELDFMRETNRRRQCLDLMKSHFRPYDASEAKTLGQCIDEAKRALSEKRKSAAKTRWNKHKKEN